MIRVVGIGNELRRDDGFGPVVARRMQELDLPDEVVVSDYGARVVHLAFDLADSPAQTIFIDAADLGALAGTVAVIEPRFDADVIAAGHEISLDSVAGMMRRLGADLDAVLVGCQPQDVSDGVGLTPVVEAAVDRAIDSVLELVRDFVGGGTIAAAGGAQT